MKKKILLPFFLLLLMLSSTYIFGEDIPILSPKIKNNAIILEQLEAFRIALINYIKTHHGEFIGREDSQDLINASIIELKDLSGAPYYDWEDPDFNKTIAEIKNKGRALYSLQEFIIDPKNKTFYAEYGISGTHPYYYKGTFYIKEDGSIEIKKVDYMTMHINHH